MPDQLKEKLRLVHAKMSTPIRWFSYLEITVFFLSTLFFSSILLLGYPSDAYEHARMIQETLSGDLLLPANFLYYLTVYIVACLNSDTWALYLSTAIVLGIAVTAKFILTRIYATQIYQNLLDTRSESTQIVSYFSLLLLLGFSLPVKYAYLGQIPPNVWHNSTTIFLMPFALVLFWLSYEQLLEPKPSRILPIIVLSGLNVIAKPSFVFVFVVSYPLMLVKQFGFRKKLWQNLIPVGIVLIAVAAMYYLIFILAHGSFAGAKSGVSIRPFSIWLAYSPNILLSLVASLIFPITYLVLYPKDLLKHSLIQYALLSYGVGVLIYAFLYETGVREGHGNFLWQAIVCSYILFLCLMAFTAEKIKRFGLFYWRNILVLLAFASHVIAGVIYLFKYSTQGTFI